jgi:hypothetical protein
MLLIFGVAVSFGDHEFLDDAGDIMAGERTRQQW